ncbi:hypothetical protein ACT691_04280 [Vibrio metschnikovii]
MIKLQAEARCLLLHNKTQKAPNKNAMNGKKDAKANPYLDVLMDKDKK